MAITQERMQALIAAAQHMDQTCEAFRASVLASAQALLDGAEPKATGEALFNLATFALPQPYLDARFAIRVEAEHFRRFAHSNEMNRQRMRRLRGQAPEMGRRRRESAAQHAPRGASPTAPASTPRHETDDEAIARAIRELEAEAAQAIAEPPPAPEGLDVVPSLPTSEGREGKPKAKD